MRIQDHFEERGETATESDSEIETWGEMFQNSAVGEQLSMQD
jgi:hypothetical protein